MAKFFISLIVVSFLATSFSAEFSRQGTKRFKNYLSQCIHRVQVTPDEIAKLLHGQPTTSTAGRCLRACLMQKAQLLLEENKLSNCRSRTLVKKAVKGDYADFVDIIRTCGRLPPDADVCVAADAYTTCLIQQVKFRKLNNFHLIDKINN